MVPVDNSKSVEYVISDPQGHTEVHVPGDEARVAAIRRGGDLLHKIRAQKQLEKRMLRAAIKLESLVVRKTKNRKRDKLAKASRKTNRK